MIQIAIDRTEELLKTVDNEKAVALSTQLDMDSTEHTVFQEKKSLAYASGRLSLEDANLLYRLLGGSPSVFNRQPLSVKMVLTRVFQELMS